MSKQLRTYSTTECHNAANIELVQCHIMFSKPQSGAPLIPYRKILNEVESQLFEKLTTAPIKGGGKYMYGKQKV